jgi:hypothetical protein
VHRFPPVDSLIPQPSSVCRQGDDLVSAERLTEVGVDVDVDVDVDADIVIDVDVNVDSWHGWDTSHRSRPVKYDYSPSRHKSPEPGY